MTIIVYDQEYLVVDRAASDGNTKAEVHKSWILPSREIVTGVGPAATIALMKEWYSGGASPAKFPREQKGDNWCEFIVVGMRGLVRYEKSHVPIDHGYYKCAFGQGRDFAYGAMAAGADAVEAAKIACHYSSWCGLGLDVYILGDEPTHESVN